MAVACTPGERDEEERTGAAEAALGQPFGGETEPNGATAQATPIGNDVVVRANIFANGDQDYYSFQANPGDRVYAAVMGAFSANGSNDADIDILAPDGTTVLETDDQNGSIGNASPSIAGTPITQAGTHYVRVRHFSATSQVRPYDLHFRTQSGAPAVEVEPNDMAPNPLPASGWVSGTLSAAADIDIYSVTVQAGDTIFASLDLDPTRDGSEINGALTIGPFAGTALQINDPGTTGPDSEAHFVTVKDAGTYGVAVSGNAAGDYVLSVSVHPAAPSVACTTYTSTDVPKTIPAAGGQVTSTIDVPSNVRAGDVDVSVQMNHAAPPDLDVHLTSPAGNTIGLFTDVGNASSPNIDTRIDDEAAYPINTFPVINGVSVEPENVYRLHWLDGVSPNGTWTLAVDDDTNNASGGTLTGWSVTICDAPIPTLACAGGSPASTAFSTDFEGGAAGFTHSGTQDEWAVGTPTAAPINTCLSGTQCFKTDLAGTYNASSSQDLVSPPIDLTQVQAPAQLRWAMKYQMESANFDHAWVEIRQVGGANPRRVWEFLDGTMTSTAGLAAATIQESAGWGTHFADVSSYVGQQVELVFHVDSDTTVNLGGLAIDDVSVLGCPLAACGNGIPEAGEACDDGNATEGDGCDSNCTPSGCGNTIVAPNEACDDGNLVNNDGCDANCTLTACGNGIITPPEVCDDGNAILGDGCDDGPAGNCTASACGNTIVAGGEGCDDGNVIDDDGCDSNCTVTGCGNGVMTAGEVCDDGNAVSGDGCDNNCTVTACGNGVQTAGEDCDDGNVDDDDGCDSNCTSTGCGNGIATSGEACDDGNAVDGDGCDTNCTDTACGNGIVTTGEECDDANTTDGDGCSSTCVIEGGQGGGGGGGGGQGGGGSTTGSTTSSSSSSTGSSGSTGSGATTGAGGEGGAGGGGDGIVEEDGCGCAVPAPESTGNRWALLLGLASAFGLRRSRRREGRR